MKIRQLAKLIPPLSVGTAGIVIGVVYERTKQRHAKKLEHAFGNYVFPSASPYACGSLNDTHDKDEGIFQKYMKSTFSVHAAKASTDNDSLPVPFMPSINPANRSAEIMKFGFPSLDNLISFDNFVLAYDQRNRNPHWVFEHIKPEHVNSESSADRNDSKFTEDRNVHQYFRSVNADYKNSGFDRGHMAAAANHRHSQSAMNQTFTLTNISPQVGKGFNRDAWNDLEKFVRAIARKQKSVYVCTGPLYLPRKETDGKLYVKYQVLGHNHVAVPTHFFKVLLIENTQGKYELMSFVMPNDVLPNKVNIKQYHVPLDAVERASGLLFFNKTPTNMFVYINGKPV